jgi:3-dehydroquinate synthetase
MNRRFPWRLAAQLAAVFSGLGLPVGMPPGIDLAEVQAAMTLDKKKAGGKVRFALPAAIGDVRTGVTVDDALLAQTLQSPA